MKMLLDQGKYGEVHKHSDTLAVKRILMKDRKVFNNETLMGVLTQNFQHTIQVRKCYIENSVGCLVMDLAHSNLFHVLSTLDVQEHVLIPLFRTLCQAVEELHDHNIAHLDLKLENVLFTTDGELKLCDFGCALETKEGETLPVPKHKVGSPVYCAPELGFGTEYQPMKADMWSLGVILHLLLVDAFPVKQMAPYISSDNIQLSFLDQVSPAAKDLVTRLLDFNPHDRPSIKEVLQHPWLSRRNERRRSSASTVHKMKSKLVKCLPKIAQL